MNLVSRLNPVQVFNLPKCQSKILVRQRWYKPKYCIISWGEETTLKDCIKFWIFQLKMLDVPKSFNPQNPKFRSTDPSCHMGNPITHWEGHSTSLLGEYIGWLPSWFEGTIYNTYLINNMIPTLEDTPILYVQYLKNTWHSPCILIYIDPLLTYLLVSASHLFWP